MQRPVKPGADVIQAADHAETLGRQPWPLVEGESYFFERHGIYGTVIQCIWWGCTIEAETDHERSSLWQRYVWERDPTRAIPLQWVDVGFALPIRPTSYEDGSGDP